MMNCEQVTRAAGDFIERRSRLRERLMVLVHIAMCRGCRAYIEQFRLTLFGLRSLPKPPAPPPAQDLLDQFRKLTGEPKQ